MSFSSPPEDYGHVGPFYDSDDYTHYQDPSTTASQWFDQSTDAGTPYYGSSGPSVHWATPNQSTINSQPQSPWYEGSSDPIYGNQAPPFDVPTPDGNAWSNDQWNNQFNDLPQSGWSDDQWDSFISAGLGGTTETESGYFPQDNFIDFGSLDNYDNNYTPPSAPAWEPWMRPDVHHEGGLADAGPDYWSLGALGLGKS